MVSDVDKFISAMQGIHEGHGIYDKDQRRNLIALARHAVELDYELTEIKSALTLKQKEDLEFFSRLKIDNINSIAFQKTIEKIKADGKI